MVKSVELFDEMLTLAELKVRTLVLNVCVDYIWLILV